MKLAKSLPAAVATLGALALMLVFATGAMAGSSEDMQFLRAFGKPPECNGCYGAGIFRFPTDVAVEQSTGDFWVSNSTINQVQKYEPRYGPGGEFLEYHLLLEFGTYASITGPMEEKTKTGPFYSESAEPGKFYRPTGMAVDQSGDLYVVDLNNHRVQKFGPNGKFILMFGGGVNETTGGNLCTQAEIEASGVKCKAGVEGAGNGAFSSWPYNGSFIAVGGPDELVYVGDNGRIQEFEASGKWKANISLASLGAGTVQSLAVDSAGDLYVQDTAAAGVRELNPAGTSQIREFDKGSTSVSAIARAPSGDVVVIDSAPNVHGIVYNPLGVELNESFGAEKFGNQPQTGMAYDDARNELIVVDFEGRVEVFKGPSIFATAITGPPIEPEAEAVTLTGEVNPEGLDASAFFEYGLCATPATCAGSPYGQTAPAVKQGTQETDFGSGTLNVNVEAHVTSGVQPNRTYHYRLVGHNENGDSPARNEEAFTTPRIAPAVEIEPASNVRFDAVDLSGAVNPENSPTSYRFLYGPCKTRTTCGASGYPSSTPPLTATRYGRVPTEPEVWELLPATTYHYRLVATNDNGETAESFEGRFTTPAAPVPGVVSGPASSVTQSTATLSGFLAPNGLAVTYGFQLGTEAGGYGPEIGLASAGAGVVGVSVALPVQNLQPGTTYHYRLMAANGYETTYGAEETFTTAGYPSPLAAPLAPPLLAVPPIPFPKEAAVVTPKKLTRAQQLSNALKACKKKSKSKRAACRRAAQKKYGAKPKKKK
jgi:hypothetical protein